MTIVSVFINFFNKLLANWRKQTWILFVGSSWNLLEDFWEGIERTGKGEFPFLPTVDLEQSEKRKNTISQMRLRSVFKMRTSILNTATTEPVSYTHLYSSSSRSLKTLEGLYSYRSFSFPFSSNSINVAYLFSLWRLEITDPFTSPFTFK